MPAETTVGVTGGLSLPAALDLEALRSVVVDLAGSNPVPAREVRWACLLSDHERFGRSHAIAARTANRERGAVM